MSTELSVEGAAVQGQGSQGTQGTQGTPRKGGENGLARVGSGGVVGEGGGGGEAVGSLTEEDLTESERELVATLPGDVSKLHLLAIEMHRVLARAKVRGGERGR
jgi:hypothetical protein